VRRLVSEGKLLPGPLSPPPDEVLPSGEGLVRNLLLGQKVAERFGATGKIGNNVIPSVAARRCRRSARVRDRAGGPRRGCGS